MFDGDFAGSVMICISIAVIYYHWFRFELVRILQSDFVSVAEKIETVAETIALEPDFCRARFLLREARTLVVRAKKASEAGGIDDLSAARLLLYTARVRADNAANCTTVDSTT